MSKWRWLGIGLGVIGLLVVAAGPSWAQSVAQQVSTGMPNLTKPVQFSSSINLMLMIAFISLIPFFLISTTCFVKVIIVLGMVRGAIGTQQSPPNAVIIALGIFLSIFIMSPTINLVNENAIKPLQAGKISQAQAIDRGIMPMRQFMLKFTREKDLALFIEFSKIKGIESKDDVPIWVIIPAFSISELQSAFQIGFLLYIPFVVIDLIISNILLTLGMFMLSPVMVSMPFKILLFVITDGWNLICRGLLLSYQ